MIQLRPYQVDAVERLREGFRNGYRAQLLVAPTGAGKTAMSAHIMEEASKRGTHVAFLVDRVSLVDQTSAALDAHGIAHGVVQARHWRRRPHERVQVCSVQTIEKRGYFPNLANGLLVVDEAHCVRKETVSLIEGLPSLRVLGLTATPFTPGLGKVYSNLVNVTTTDALVRDGFLSPLRTYAATSLDMSGARVIAGEWSERDIEKRGRAIIGDIVAEWRDKTSLHFGGPVKTIVFAATVDHGADLCEQFNAAGYRFEQISYKDGNESRRRELIAEYRKPDSEIVGLVSCEVFSRGFDVPDVLCGISARPYRKSLSSHVQQVGRVMRTSPGKEFALWLDHSGNVLRFHADTMELFANGVSSLDDRALDSKARREPDDAEREAIKCSACGFVLPPLVHACPACGHERKRRPVETLPGGLVLVGGSAAPVASKHPVLAKRDEVWRQLVCIGLERKQGDVEGARRFAQAQYRNFYGDFARRDIEKTAPLDADPALRKLVTANIIRWAKSRNRVAA